MRECNCETVVLDDVRTEHVVHDHVRALVHNDCGGVFDPALKIVREQRTNPAGPHMSNVEYRADGLDDGT